MKQIILMKQVIRHKFKMSQFFLKIVLKKKIFNKKQNKKNGIDS